jgi:hypothetical protein
VPLRDPDNRGLLEYLAAAGRDPRLLTAPEEGQRDPYLEAGSHPDVVARVWDELGAQLPPGSRCLVLGTPALIRAGTGTVLAVTLGTTYALRVPGSRWDEALALGARQAHHYTAGSFTLDVGERFGRDWIFGLWAKPEAEWCREAYELGL